MSTIINFDDAYLRSVAMEKPLAGDRIGAHTDNWEQRAMEARLRADRRVAPHDVGA